MEKIIASREKSTNCDCVILTLSDGTKQREPCEKHKHVMELFDKLAKQEQLLSVLGALVEVHSNIIVAYKILSDGCVRHQTYRAKGKPQKGYRNYRCKGCERLWRVKLYLDKLKTKGIPIMKEHEIIQHPPTGAMKLADDGEQDVKDATQAGEGEPFVASEVEQPEERGEAV
jgi:hypothetical protein